MRQRVKPWTRWHGGILVPSMSGAGLVESGGGEPGDLVHGESASVSGSFTSATIREAVYDTCDHGQSITTRWSGGWPSNAGGGRDLHYTTPAALGRGVATPYSRLTHYLAGNHAGIQYTATDGNNVGVWRSFTRTLGDWHYMSWWTRADPNWFVTVPYGPGDDDNNFKEYCYSDGSSPYNNNYWYGNMQNGGWTSANQSSILWTTHHGDGTGGPESTYYSSIGQPNPRLGWAKIEILLLLANTTNGGRYRVWFNGSQAYSTNMRTDAISGSTRSEMIGGYARNRGANQWRYQTNIIYRRSTQPTLLYLTDNATWNSSTASARVPQPITSISSSEIQFVVDGGNLLNGTRHLHLRDEVNGNQYLGAVTLTG